MDKVISCTCDHFSFKVISYLASSLRGEISVAIYMYAAQLV